MKLITGNIFSWGEFRRYLLRLDFIVRNNFESKLNPIGFPKIWRNFFEIKEDKKAQQIRD